MGSESIKYGHILLIIHDFCKFISLIIGLQKNPRDLLFRQKFRLNETVRPIPLISSLSWYI